MNDFEPTKGKMEILIQQDLNYKTILAEGVIITTTPSDKIELVFYIRKMNKPEKIEFATDDIGDNGELKEGSVKFSGKFADVNLLMSSVILDLNSTIEFHSELGKRISQVLEQENEHQNKK